MKIYIFLILNIENYLSYLSNSGTNYIDLFSFHTFAHSSSLVGIPSLSSLPDELTLIH